MNRIHIVGGPGSGKTSLARKLGNDDSRPVIDLDAIGYVGGAGQRRPLQAKLHEVHELANQPAWTTEGVFLWWTDALLERAEMIVWLDPPWRVACWRILKRHMKASMKGTNKHKGLKRLWSFLKSARKYYNDPAFEPEELDDDGVVSRSATELALSRFSLKVVQVRSNRELKTLLGSFRN